MKLFHVIFLSIILVFSGFAIQAAPVDINTADAKTIAKATKGIGLKKAEAIVAYRDKHGSYKSVADLAKVKGIGKKTIASNKAALSVGNAKYETK